MIQRIQSLFLLGAIAMLTLTIFLPIWSNETSNVALNLSKTDLVPTGLKNIIILIVLGVGILLALVSLFMYKNRPLQMKLNGLVILLSAAAVGGLVMRVGNYEEAFMGEGSFGIGYFMPIGGVVFTLLATRFIKKDEELVRSADRMR